MKITHDLLGLNIQEAPTVRVVRKLGGFDSLLDIEQGVFLRGCEMVFSYGNDHWAEWRI
jgi:hypothetical protein